MSPPLQRNDLPPAAAEAIREILEVMPKASTFKELAEAGGEGAFRATACSPCREFTRCVGREGVRVISEQRAISNTPHKVFS